MENLPRGAGATGRMRPKRYMIRGVDRTLSGPILQDRIDHVGFFAKEFMELQGLAFSAPGEALDALLDALQETGLYFVAKTDTGAVAHTKICYQLQKALLHHLDDAV
jgi:hypothetical protein